MGRDEPWPRRDEREPPPEATSGWTVLAQLAWYLSRCTTSTAVAVRTVFIFLGLCLPLATVVVAARLTIDGTTATQLAAVLTPVLSIMVSGLTVIGSGLAFRAARRRITRRRRKRLRAERRREIAGRPGRSGKRGKKRGRRKAKLRKVA
jgi:hypothetical protein